MQFLFLEPAALEQNSHYTAGHRNRDIAMAIV